MKYSCEVVRDLLPLFTDGVCSKESEQVVTRHLGECADCMEEYKRLQNTACEDSLKQKEAELLKRYRKEVRKKTVTAGSCIAAVLLIPVLVCFIVNLAAGHALDWFFFVLTALLVTASVTVLPLLVSEKRGLYTLGGFTASLLLLLLTCCIYSGGRWFFVAAAAVLLGLSTLFMPFVIGQLQGLRAFKNRRGLFSMLADTAFLFALLAAVGVFLGSAAFWRPAMLTALVCGASCWIVFLTLRYLPVNRLIKTGLAVLECGCIFAFINNILNWIYGSDVPTILEMNLRVWNYETTNGNCFFLGLAACVLVGAVFLIAGLVRRKR